VAKSIEKIQCDILWGGINEEFRFHLVSWNKVCSPIFEGGLGIWNLHLMNHALLGKWLWRFASEKEAWWRKILVAKYGAVWGGWRSWETSGSHGVGLWKYICRGLRSFQCHIRFDPGFGSNIRFWEDIWCGKTSLKDPYPGLFNIATNKDASIADNRECLNGSI
jgi:hypothetical protein